MNTMQREKPPLHAILDLGEAAAGMQRLLLLDAAWTSAEKWREDISLV